MEIMLKISKAIFI